MFKNLVKTSIRNILKNKLFTSINLFGLSVSISLCLLVITLISEIKSYDNFHDDADNIYRIITHQSFLDRNVTNFASTTLAPLSHLKEEFPEIEKVVGFRDRFSGDMSSDSKTLPLFGLYMDDSFFDVFSFPLASGNPETALSEPFSIVLTQEASIKLYGNEDPIGKILTMTDGDAYQVTGVLEKTPSNTHIKFEALASLSTRSSLESHGDLGRSMTDWYDIYTNYIYVKLRSDASLENIEQRLNELAAPIFVDDERIQMSFSLQELSDVMSGRELSNQLGISIPPIMLLILGILAMLIMLTAAFNYTNLSLARGIRRAKEVGVRKVVGAKRGQVVLQFIIESLLITFLALIFGYFIFFFIRDLFLGLAPEMSTLVSLDITPFLLIKFLGFAAMVGLLAGIFPAIVLSKVKAISALRSSNSLKLFKHVNLRKALLIVQFTLSLVFINATYIMSRQYQFVQNFDLGYTTDNVLNVPLQGNDIEMVKNAFQTIPEVESISFSQFIPSTGTASSTWAKYKNDADSASINLLGVDHNYLPLHEFKLLSGENFEARDMSDANRSIIVNEKFLALFELGSPDDALGEIIDVDGNDAYIRGVVQDFPFVNLNRTIGPFIFTQPQERLSWANLKLNATNIPGTMKKIEEAWQNVDPLHEMNAQFFEERIQRAYGQFSIMSKVIGFVSFLAISIATLGLLGMAVYIIETRMKEVSIRKVLGASAQTLINLLSSGFVKMLIIAIIVALPITYALFEQVIFSNFINHVNIGFLELSVGVILIMVMSVITIGSQVYKAATSNPVNELRTD